MSTPHRSLNDRVLWLQMLDALGLPVDTQAIPSVTRCPFCKGGRLMILQDTLIGGQWHWCQGCHRCGDMIELAAKVWRLSIPATISKLVAMGFNLPESRIPVDIYIKDQLKYRRSVRELWEQAKKNVLFQGSSGTGRVVSVLGLSCGAPHSRWLDGPGQLAGGLTVKQIEEALVPSVVGQCQIFRGNRSARWDDMLAIPFYDLPGRICSMLFVGREARPDKDYLLRLMNLDVTLGISRYSDLKGRPRELGVSMHPGIFDASTEWGNRVVVLDDPIIAFRLHSRHCEQSTRILPMISWYCTDKARPINVWRMFVGRQLIFWAPKMTRHIIHQAATTGSLISTRSTEAPLQEFINRRTPEELMEEIKDHAVPWEEAVSEHLSSLTDAEIEDLLLQLQLDGMDVGLIKRKVSGPLRSRLDVIMASRSVGRTIQFSDRTVVERDDGWYVEGKKPGTYELIMDAQLRIDTIVNQPRLHKQYYQGRLIYKGHELPFCVPDDQLNRQPFKLLNQLVLDAELGYLCFATGWNMKLAQLSRQLYPPTFVTGLDTVGWSLRMSSFILPAYRIELGGEIHKGNIELFPPNSPATNVPWPEVMSGQEMDEMFGEDDATTAILWALLTAISANIIAPAFHEPTSGIIVAGPGVERLAYVVENLCGCRESRIAGGMHMIERMLNIERMHNWPVVMLTRRKATGLEDWIDPNREDEGAHNCIASLGWYMTTVKKLTAGWHVIEDSRAINDLSVEARQSVKKFLPAYLLDLCRRRLAWKASSDLDWFSCVLNDISDFVTRSGGPGREVFKAESAVFPDRDEGFAESFVDLVFYLTRDSAFISLPEGFEDLQRKKPSITIKEDCVSVPKQALVDILVKKHVHLKDLSRVTSVLRAAEVLKEDSGTHWDVCKTWWNARVRTLNNDRSGTLRIHGT